MTTCPPPLRILKEGQKVEVVEGGNSSTYRRERNCLRGCIELSEECYKQDVQERDVMLVE